MVRWRFVLIGLALSLIVTEAWGQREDGAQAPPQVAISPPYVEMQISEGGSDVQALKLFNFSDAAVRVEVLAANWEFDPDNNVKVIEPTEQSLDQWLLVNPLRFEVAPRSAQTVRLAARPRVSPDPGEHRAMVFFRQRTDDAAPGGTFRTLFNIGIAVYGYMEPIERKASVHDVLARVSEGRAQLDVDISSSGNAHVRMDGKFAVWRQGTVEEREQLDSDDPDFAALAVRSGELPDTPVLPGARRTVKVPVGILEPGLYVASLRGQLADVVLDRRVEFEVPEHREAPTGIGEPSEDAQEEGTEPSSAEPTGADGLER